MKNLIFILCTSLLLFVTSCKNDDVETKITVTSHEFEFYGEEHNKALNFMLDKIMDNPGIIKLDGPHNITNAKTVIESFTLNYIATLTNLTEEERAAAQGSCVPTWGDIEDFLGLDTLVNIPYYLQEMDGLDFSNFQEEILTKISSALHGVSSSSNLATRLSSIEDEITQNASNNEEAALLYASLSLAQNSYNYWNDNLILWQDAYVQIHYANGITNIPPTAAGCDAGVIPDVDTMIGSGGAGIGCLIGGIGGCAIGGAIGGAGGSFGAFLVYAGKCI